MEQVVSEELTKPKVSYHQGGLGLTYRMRNWTPFSQCLQYSWTFGAIGKIPPGFSKS